MRELTVPFLMMGKVIVLAEVRAELEKMLRRTKLLLMWL
jgi:hypothetical protein